MAWKRFTVGQAEFVALGLEDRYLRSCIAQSQCLLSRLAGDIDQAAKSLEDLSEASLPMDKRMHSAIGQVTIQRSLNHIQIEDLPAAKKSLEDWGPLDQSRSRMEEVVLVRKGMILGKAMRFQGNFAESRKHLEQSQRITEQRKDLTFDEDLRDLTCDLADTLRELDEPLSAEHYLRMEIARRDYQVQFSGRSLLELSLAEALFAQKRFKEAEGLCLGIQSRTGLLKFEKLRLQITLAKIRHVESDNEGALSCWSGAMGAIGKFPRANGRTTRIIVMSICDTLGSLGHTWLMHWIAGLRHWLKYLQSPGLRSRM